MSFRGENILELLDRAEKIAEVMGELKHIPLEDLQIFAASLILNLGDKPQGESYTKAEVERLIAKNRELLNELKNGKRKQ